MMTLRRTLRKTKATNEILVSISAEDGISVS
jgi:hypothetical protein